jgi:subfamily B ATP-binding cassette protein MsbA
MDQLVCLTMLGGAAHKGHIAVAAAIATVLIAVVTGAAMYAVSYFTESLSQSIGNDLRVRLYSHLQELSLAYYDTTRVGTILSALTSDVQTIQSFASTATLNIVTNTLTVVGMIVVMLLCRWDFTLIAVAVTPLLFLFVLRVNKAVRTAVREVRTHQSDLTAILQEGLQSIQVVQAFGREDHQAAQVRAASMNTVTAWLNARRVSSLLSPIVGMAIALCTGPCSGAASLLILAGTMTVGALTVFLVRTWPVLSADSRSGSDDQHHRSGIGGVRARRRTHGHRQGDPETATPDTVAVARRNHLQPRRIRLDPSCQCSAISRSPSSRARWSASSAPPAAAASPRSPASSRGSATPMPAGIKIDGVDVRDYALRKLRAQIGFVLQDTVLLRGTVRDNIGFGRPDATEDEIVEAAKLANAHEFITRMPNGYDSVVGDRGMTLSGGQRQRIGIARALIRDNPILILDEPTAALDAESEHLVVEALERLVAGRTVIAIAHRLARLQRRQDHRRRGRRRV